MVKESLQESLDKKTRARMEHHAITRIAAANTNMDSFLSRNSSRRLAQCRVRHYTAASLHLEENGIHESLVLELSQNLWDVSTNVVWIADGGRFPTEADIL